MPETKKPPSVPAADLPAKRGAPVALARRRLLHGGLAAGPVLMTLVSRPVLGTVQCVTPSAFVSGNASVASSALVCAGYPPDYWVDNPNWPPPYTPDTPFCDVFGASPGYPAGCCDALIDVLSPPDVGLPDPAPPAPPPVGKHHKGNSHPHSPFSGDEAPHDQSPRNQSPRDPGTSRRGPSALDPSALGLAPLGQKKLQVATSDEQAPRHNPSSGQQASGDGNHQHQHGVKHKGPVQTPEPDPTPSDPIPVDPLGCNDHTTPAPDPSPDPGPPSTTPGRRKKHSHSRPSHVPTQHDAVARHVVAALLNAQAGLTPAVTVRVVKGIWGEYVAKGYFEPTAGVQWGPQDILTYLVSTQPA